MGILDETRFVERLQFFDGQRLFASDLQGIEAFHREMRWLHNRSLHQPGIGNGFKVTGRRDGREVRVGPGYAIDALGREIVLTRELVEPVPPVAGETDGQSVFFDLVVSYPDDASLEVTETRQGICLPRGAVRLREEPVLCWVRLKRDAEGNLKPQDPKLAQEILDGLRILLARAEVIDCRLRFDVSLAERRNARAAASPPHIACGETEIPNTAVTLQDPAYLFIYLLRFEIDTSAAGFQTTPCYSVHLARPRIVDYQGNPRFLMDGWPQILEPSAESFTVEVLIRVIDHNPLEDDGTPRAAAPDGVAPPEPSDPRELWRARWMGVE